LKSCQWSDESLFAQAHSFANVLADEANISVVELLSFRSLQVRFSKIKGSTYRQIKVKFHKVWDLTHYTSVQSLHQRHGIVTSMSSVMKRLFGLFHAAYEDRKNTGDYHRQTLPPFALNLQKFVAHKNNLLLYFILSLVLVDHVFDITEAKEGQVDRLFRFCEKFFGKVVSQTTFWKLLDSMLRVHHGKNNKVIEYCRRLPTEAEDQLEAKSVEYPAEVYRDWLCSKIHDTRSNKSNVYYNGADIGERNILIYSYYVLQHVYSSVDSRFAPNYKPTFLFTKISQSTHDKMLEQVRHKNLGKAKKAAYDIPPARQRKTTSKKGDKASGDDSKKDIDKEDTNNKDQDDAVSCVNFAGSESEEDDGDNINEDQEEKSDHSNSDSSKRRDDEDEDIQDEEDETANAPGQGKIDKVAGDDATANCKLVHVFVTVMIRTSLFNILLLLLVSCQVK
jgi:hypothetical protein